MHGILFDIDGTVLRAGGAGRAAMALAIAKTTGVSKEHARAQLKTMDFRGRTDALLFAEMARRVGRPDTDIPATYDAYVIALEGTLAERDVELLPGVAALIEQLEAREDVLVGLLTGNIRAGAERKLGAVGLERLADRPGGFGDDGRIREDLAERASERLREHGVSRLVVIGDTGHDVRAGRHIGAATVAVATGWTDIEELRSTGADLVLEDLSDPQPVLALINHRGAR